MGEDVLQTKFVILYIFKQAHRVKMKGFYTIANEQKNGAT